MTQTLRWVPGLWALLLGTLMLGPALLPGYVLAYDMVWVPDLALRPDMLGLGSGLPRAVPSDAVVAVLDEVVPAMLLQKAVLLGALTAGGAGAAALVPELPLLARCASVTAYVWSPFAVERLWIGHWPLLITYAVLPWLLLGVRAWRRGGAGRGWWLLVALGSLSAAGGVLTAVAVAVGAAGRLPARRWAEAVTVLLAGNAPWLVAGLLHAADARGDARGAAVFALSDEGVLPGPVAALGLGGIWNADTVPGSRQGVLAVVALLLLLALAGLAVRRRALVDDGRRLLVLWSIGWATATVTWLLPGPMATLVSGVPGGGLMRDGARALALCAPLVAVVVGQGVAAVGGMLAVPLQRTVVTACLVLAPIALMPDASALRGGRLEPVRFPSSYADARAAVGERADVLVLPFTSYRAPSWNGGRPVLDPLGRYLRPDYVASDVLVVDGRPVRGEDPRAAAVVEALGRDDPAPRLGHLGIRVVVTDTFAGGDAPRLDGRVLLAGEVEAVELADWRPRREPGWWRWPLCVAWAAFAGLVLMAAARALRTVASRMRTGALPAGRVPLDRGRETT